VGIALSFTFLLISFHLFELSIERDAREQIQPAFDAAHICHWGLMPTSPISVPI
jgi:hypothetical protein